MTTSPAPTATPEKSSPLDGETLGQLYFTMQLSRLFDDACADLLEAGTPLPHYHSGVGQEALMVAAVAPLRPTDQMIYTHRGYGHLLAKGVPLTQIACDLFNKVGGTNAGMGGVMHVNRPDLGVPGREGVFGTRFGIAVGLALAARAKDENQVVVCFYGEAAGARGQLYEALNMAVLWNLPIIFIAENNGWSFTSRTSWLYPEGSMTRVWRGFDIPVAAIDGNDAETVYHAVDAAVARARRGEGPSVLEGMTYRVAPHIWYDKAAYQPDHEVAEWRGNDPVHTLRTRLSTTHPSIDLHGLDEQAAQDVQSAMHTAMTAPLAGWADSHQGAPECK